MQIKWREPRHRYRNVFFLWWPLIHFIEIYIATKHVFQLQKCGPVLHPELFERLRFQIILHDWHYSFCVSRFSLKHLSQYLTELQIISQIGFTDSSSHSVLFDFRASQSPHDLRASRRPALHDLQSGVVHVKKLALGLSNGTRLISNRALYLSSPRQISRISWVYFL